MADFSRNAKIVITCPKNITPFTALEVEKLGFKVQATQTAFVETEGNLVDCMKLNMWLRTAHKVLYKISEFSAVGPDELYKEINRIPWENFIDSDGYFSVTSQVLNDNIRDTRFANLKVKDAVADRIKQMTDKRPDSGPEKDKVVLFLHWDRVKATLYIDTSGETIAKHGYRKLPFKAPMQETLAAAVIMATKWKSGDAFINPMCGSGTLGIEALLMEINKAPGLMRHNFGFMHLKGFPKDKWVQIETSAMAAIREPAGKYFLSDHDPEAIAAARKNAELAGVDEYIDFAVSDFREVEVPENSSGIVILNPEYGERLGDVADLETIYREIGDFFKKKCAGYTGYIFTGNLDLGKKIGLKSKRKIPFYNGTLESRLFEFELYSGTRKINKSL